ncbi:10279_t:CDS:1, partial [Scutellospora calospora]
MEAVDSAEKDKLLAEELAEMRKKENDTTKIVKEIEKSKCS